MIRKVLFDKQVEVGISEISDGDMRFFGEGDESAIISNQKKLGEEIKLESVARIRTIYEGRESFTDYVEVTNENFTAYSIDNPEKDIPVSDGIATRVPEIGIMLPLADCLGAVFFDEKQKIVGLLHAGRRNVEQEGPRKFVEYFINHFGSKPEDIKIYCSPYAINYRIYKFDKKLGEAAKEQFINSGILEQNIIDPLIDTVDNENYPSNCSGDTTKRFAIVAKLVLFFEKS